MQASVICEREKEVKQFTQSKAGVKRNRRLWDIHSKQGDLQPQNGNNNVHDNLQVPAMDLKGPVLIMRAMKLGEKRFLKIPCEANMVREYSSLLIMQMNMIVKLTTCNAVNRVS
ncbi:hypothetical protein FEM48_Zijuj03G0182600 [Ziziphus jujuba var. spinosa]|uniref:Uncharacterized protein n=1 Tax=Ziziphus jujuba var. spinosa TaxID=714518 RepID=A0A978VRV3_ZIZJJ|nr:hypothetical protein FEM48_Zijuj03G0182600 [Ziziphus jujuba var. spinosa]